MPNRDREGPRGRPSPTPPRHTGHVPGGSITNPDAARVNQAQRNSQSEARTTARGSCSAAKARAPTCWCSTRGPASRPVSGARNNLARPIEWRTPPVTCPLVPSVPHLVSGSCSSPRAFALGFLPTPPRGDAVALPLAFGFSFTWRGDLHPTSYVPCPAHTLSATHGGQAVVCADWLCRSWALTISSTISPRVLTFVTLHESSDKSIPSSFPASTRAYSIS